VTLIVKDDPTVDDRRAYGARAECSGEVKDGKASLFGQEQVSFLYIKTREDALRHVSTIASETGRDVKRAGRDVTTISGIATRLKTLQTLCR
jgi:hypothetical protein